MSELRRVADVMTRDPISMREEDDVWEVEQEMSNLGLRHVPIADNGKVVGLLTSQHLLSSSADRRNRDPIQQRLAEERKHGKFVADIMEREVVTVGPDTPLEKAAELIAARKIGCLPVVEQDLLVGILTESDLMQLLASLLRREAELAGGSR